MTHRCVVCGRLATEVCSQPVHAAHRRMWEEEATWRRLIDGPILGLADTILARMTREAA